MWLIILSNQLLIVALGSHYLLQLANQTQAHLKAGLPILSRNYYEVLSFVSKGYSSPKGRFLRVTHPSATQTNNYLLVSVRLACVKHTASVHPEPGSNSQKIKEKVFELLLSERFNLCLFLSLKLSHAVSISRSP